MATDGGIELLTIGAPGDTHRPQTVHLIVRDGEPVLLGEGRFAKVYLGVYGDPSAPAPGELVALKFLQKADSAAITANYTYRFYQEIAKSLDCRRVGVQDGIVGFHAFGRIGAYSPSDVDLIREVFRVDLSADPAAASRRSGPFQGWSLADLEQVFEQNASNATWTQSLTGDFYVMQLCLFSLEELLIAQGSPADLSGASAMDRCGIKEAPILQWIAAKQRAVQQSGIRLKEGASGFQDLLALEQAWVSSCGRLGAPASGSLKGAVMCELATACIDQVSKLHAFQHGSERGLAHRDLKPGNVLLSIEEPTRFVLSDLGFVAAVSEIKAPGRSRGGELEEGSVLPAGSRGFRAPEQIESGQDIAFTVSIAPPPAPGEEPETWIVLPTNLGAEPEAGDWLYTREIGSESSTKQRITKVTKPGDGSVRCRIPRKVGSSGKVLLKGRLVKDVALHSDLFALGCISYYLGSEGQDPERFFQAFVDPIALAMNEAKLPAWVVASPLWMAAVLCQERPDVLARDLEHYVAVMPEEEKLGWRDTDEGEAREAALAAFDTHAQRMIDVLLWDAGPRRPWGALMAIFRGWRASSDVARIRASRHGLADSATLRPRLVGKVSGTAVSFPLLYLTLLCCMRDRSASLVRRGKKEVTPQGEIDEVFNAEASEYASAVLNVATRLTSLPSVSVRVPQWAGLGRNPLEIFLAARIGATRIAGSPTAVEVEARADVPSGGVSPVESGRPAA
jgi:serine/threonine protein kinase